MDQLQEIFDKKSHLGAILDLIGDLSFIFALLLFTIMSKTKKKNSINFKIFFRFFRLCLFIFYYLIKEIFFDRSKTNNYFESGFIEFFHDNYTLLFTIYSIFLKINL